MSANIIFSIFLYLFSYLINNYNARDLTITRSSTCTLLVVLTVIVILLTAQVIKLELYRINCFKPIQYFLDGVSISCSIRLVAYSSFFLMIPFPAVILLLLLLVSPRV